MKVPLSSDPDVQEIADNQVAVTGVYPISIVDEMKRSYLDYAMSVIVSRALPDVRDGLKPVHRRILFAMRESGYDWDKAHRKSARVVGDVIGKYHPHGDSAIYGALVRMAQSFSMELPLVDGQGNFGSIDGDAAAAMRYTEVRLEKVAHHLLNDLYKDTVNFVPNYDGSEREPSVLPACFPNLLVNGAGGIAVGMATNIPSHNLGEVIAAIIALINKPDFMSEDELIDIMPGPDFPTGGIIIGRSGIRDYYLTGRGHIILRGRASIEEIRAGREAIVITEFPYQVNKADVVTHISDLSTESKIEGISEVRDESDRDGCRVVIELKRDASSEVILNQLYRFTALQTSIRVNAVALNNGKPELMTIKSMLLAFINFREEVVLRRTRFLLAKARERAHLLVGLAIAVANVDEVVTLMRTASNPEAARTGLLERLWPAGDMAEVIALIADPEYGLNEDGTCRLSRPQSNAILDLRLQRITALGRDDIAEELQRLASEITDYLSILRSRERVSGIVTQELEQVSAEFATPRKTDIVDLDSELCDEDLIRREEMVVTVTYAGWIKRVPLSVYRAQRRGGKGRSGVNPREEDFVTRMFVASTHAQLLFFSSHGQVYTTKLWRLPLAVPQARGKALVNLFPLEKGERVTSILVAPEDESQWADLSVVFATTFGMVRRNKLSDFGQINRAGKLAMKLEPGEGIVAVEICGEDDDILLTTAGGRCIRFPVSRLRVFRGRGSRGVSGIALGQGDTLISMAVLKHFDATPEERMEYLKWRRATRDDVDAQDLEVEDVEDVETVAIGSETVLTKERYAAMSDVEQFILTVSENGYGKRTSSFEYRVTSRGGKGIVAMAAGGRNGKLVTSFPVGPDDQIMLVTGGGQLIRCPVDSIRIAGRSTLGVIVFNTAKNEHVVAVERLNVYEDGAEES